jgi:hypothetical protein
VEYVAGERISKQSNSTNIIPQQFAAPLLSISGSGHPLRHGDIGDLFAFSSPTVQASATRYQGEPAISTAI